MAPQSSVPPSLPPSVEEAYRRKCIQLKNRTNEVEEANDAARLRLARIKRQVEKLRIERAFLLEQLAKRTSTNVEDSEGSPSPPPTEHFSAGIHEADANVRKPKDKPLRIKRGHRKTDADGKDTPSASFTQRAGSGSPAPSEQGDSGKKGTTNGAKKSAKPSDAFELFCSEERAAVEEQSKDKEDANVDEELERRWKELSDEKKDEYKTQFEELVKRREKEDKDSKEDEDKEDKEDEDKDKEDDDKEKEKEDAALELKKEDEPASSKPAAQDEDVEMGNSENAEQAEEKEDKEDKEDKEAKESKD
uniref:HMG box domain-containing protein n=1 Tax=Bionectria ochroleuca TaxID=29856 RepID=A0A8H7NAJ4_BIOOC